MNPGCFRSFQPPNDGDCTCSASQFFLQIILPNVDREHRVKGLRFWSNDAETVFPAVGVLVSNLDANDDVPLPAPEQLASLQARDVSSTTDTTSVFVDLDAASLVVPAGASVVLFAVVQFPATGRLTQIGKGPGILADTSLPDQECDLFTLDGGLSWQTPLFVPGDPQSEPLDWGFEILLDPTSDTESLSWSQVKRIYRSP